MIDTTSSTASTASTSSILGIDWGTTAVASNWYGNTYSTAANNWTGTSNRFVYANSIASSRDIQRDTQRLDALHRYSLGMNMPRDNEPALPRSVVQVLSDGAAERAMALLHSCLNDEQRDMLRTRKKFRIVSNLLNIFEIRLFKTHNIYKLDLNGQAVENWCVLPKGDLALGDVLLAQKVWLETDEADTAKYANITHIASGRLTHYSPVQYAFGVHVPVLLN